ncbi:MAG: 5-formyltetrahydrofolate cyclo-ligase [Alphaproteobacteria bacterium]
MRAEAKAARPAAAAAAGPDAAERLAARFLADFAFLPGETVSGYVAMGGEMDPRPLLLHAIAAGCGVALPVVRGRGKPLAFRAWRPGDVLADRPMGLSEPGPDAPEVEPDLLLVPLLAFDTGCRRIGYGAGYYDMTLAGLRTRRPVRAIGIAYDGQRVARVPTDPWDAGLDAVVTEAATYRPPTST